MTTDRSKPARHANASLFHDATKFYAAPGCDRCVDKPLCGGIAAGGLFDCMSRCCGKPATCEWVCRRNPRFTKYVQTIRGLSLDNIAIAAAAPAPVLPLSAPLIYHASRRVEPLRVPAAAIKLAQLFDRRTGMARFHTRLALADKFKIAEDAVLIASGVDKDPVIERWWGIGQNARRAAIAAFKAAGIGMVTCPNFTLCADWPRTGDLAAMKRISLCYEEFADSGLPAALHLNGRTDADFVQWIAFLKRNPLITHVSFEFTTGTARADRRPLYVRWLIGLARSVERPLHIVLYGDAAVVPELAGAFAGTTWIDTSSFLKAVHRQAAIRIGNTQLGWHPSPTPVLANIDNIISNNVAETSLLHSQRAVR